MSYDQNCDFPKKFVDFLFSLEKKSGKIKIKSGMITSYYYFTSVPETVPLTTRPYLYSEVEHQAIWVSLCQLVEKISPSCVCYHLLQPSRSLKTPENYMYELQGVTLFFIILLISKPIVKRLLENLTSPSTVKIESAFCGSKCFMRRFFRWFSTRS